MHEAHIKAHIETERRGLGPTDAELDRINTELKSIRRVGDLRAWAEAGQFILDTFFGGRVDAWENRSPAKEASIRRLAQRPGAPYRKDALTRRVRVCVALRRHPFVYDCDGLSAAHVMAVLRLPAPEQESLLLRAHLEAWSARQLGQFVVVMRQRDGERRGAPASPPAVQALVRLRRLARDFEAALAVLCDGDAADPSTASEAVMQIQTIQAACERAQRGLTVQKHSERPFVAKIRAAEPVSAARAASLP